MAKCVKIVETKEVLVKKEVAIYNLQLNKAEATILSELFAYVGGKTGSYVSGHPTTARDCIIAMTDALCNSGIHYSDKFMEGEVYCNNKDVNETIGE